MKNNRYQRRFYRDWVNSGDLYATHILEKETDLYIMTNKLLDKNFIQERIRSYRWEIENYIIKDNRFLTTLKPLNVELNTPQIIKEMAEQARKVNVGPMAAVAGAIAQFIARDLLRLGYKDVIVENGGDLFIKTTKIRKVAIYAGRAKAWRGLSLKIKPVMTPLGICTSSGTIGHSLSFGIADCVIILAKNAALADATATACGNIVQSKSDLNKAINFVKSTKGIIGAVIILKNDLISWGKVEFSK
jgi:ApbE superfamily uncharacterized protein (UPF0280 family)